MTTTFYIPPEMFRDGWVVLPPDEAHHAVRVLRHRPGDEVVAVDGEGGWYRLRLEQVDRQTVGARVLETRRDHGEPPYHLTVGLALLKQSARFETFLEKAVELGVQCILPLQTERTERVQFRLERAQRILVAALKQCGRSRLPRVLPPQTFTEAIRKPAALRLLCHEQPDAASLPLGQLLCGQRMPNALVLIGPEGGFSGSEVRQALAAGFQLVSLGPRRLRAETAALVAASAFSLYWEAQRSPTRSYHAQKHYTNP
ncbi:RsmE family RNA methyltransferase [Rhodothermus bifroesti]|uniref:RsmE family RNA methyltransferase n=1 Tax=Rhodothermus bifroesti TaxID=2823335 RepID=UPI001AEFB7D7|nr:RsmE family RNA methyltransferase [Rhodothermus bifroesti]